MGVSLKKCGGDRGEMCGYRGRKTWRECVKDDTDELGLQSSGVATGGNGRVRTPTSVQTPPEIRANPLRSILYIGGGGCPMHVYCNFLLLTSRKNCSDPPTFFWAGDATGLHPEWAGFRDMWRGLISGKTSNPS